MRVELVRRVLAPGQSGPTNGMYGLQRALLHRLRRDPILRQWLSIVDAASSDRSVVPWFWNWKDRHRAVECERRYRPFIQGPNMVFLRASRPRSDDLESALLDSHHTQAMFCHTPWYRDLIAKHRGIHNTSPIVLWPYPIDPMPGPPLPAKFDVMIYDKGRRGQYNALANQICQAFPQSVLIRYGSYARASLFEAARTSRSCVYLTESDHGPLALQEILLAGCPTVGVRTGAAFVRQDETGILLSSYAAPLVIDGLEQAMRMDRELVRVKALEEFSSDAIINTVILALDQARQSKPYQPLQSAARTLSPLRSTRAQILRLMPRSAPRKT